ncbi:MAG: bifunctional methylenetetrahydrofolate dehydrogenase/methenyltetrahydrofolate cyclohydrolase FolD [Xanthobacteraceae bacterium]|nr:bifunctional methylenetetrahydrofolate dehydrogenase/methenyltetrahydrofolate cyclohydrolase FolD [Xanthobacteraceae bacterium]QYK44932.1 MAG: bifunctional methylenetetrahydrofolate dehydrogenase/methenyltetrahydrofolate cyclohydrolase FolD [Xanthobacteraceae bacterium]
MSAKILDGKALADEVRAKVAAAVPGIAAKLGRKPGFAAVLVGEDPASQTYVRSKEKATLEAGMASFEHRLPEGTSEKDLLALIAKLNADESVDGILVQLPVPKHIDTARVIEAIDPAKDVDGFHPVNVGRLAAGLPALVPGTPLGCILLAKKAHASLAGMEAVVLGRSNIVGKPLAQLLLAENATVTIAHSRTKNIEEVCRRADVLCVAIGKPQFVKADWIKPGATVIDVGINRVAGADGKSKLVGDVAFDEASKVAGWVTPVPGGVGRMTVACLLVNTLRAACARAGIEAPKL